MSTDKFQQLACPLDGLALHRQANTLKCSQGHSYDVARQGYVNLLPVQQKKSSQPGDSKEMIAARGRHLDAGFYEPIAQRLCDLSTPQLAQGDPLTCLDAGCGEGYYLSFFSDYLERQNMHGMQLTGLDISKPAIIAAAKRNKQVTWVVGNSQHAPVIPSSIKLLWSVFGFQHLRGFRDMLSKSGKLIMVDAGAQHLIEIREIIYAHIKPAEALSQSLASFAEHGLRQTEQQTLTYRTSALSASQLADLLLMTPHLFRATSAGKQALSQLHSLALTVDVNFQVFEAG